MSTSLQDLTMAEATEVLGSLRSGVPPRRFASAYSAGWDTFLDGVEKRHLRSKSSAGRISFISGKWGGGKTHLMRLLAEKAFAANYLVSSIELTKDEAPFNKFEQVFFRIINNI